MARLICIVLLFSLVTAQANSLVQKKPSASNAAVVDLFQSGQGEEAAELGEEVLQDLRASLGDTHPNTLQAEMNLGAIYHALGRLDEAQPLVSNATAGFLNIQGPTGPGALNGLALLRLVYEDLEQIETAIGIYESVLEMHDGLLGPDHPVTQDTVAALSEMHMSLQQYAEALPFHLRLTQSLEVRIGVGHPDTLQAITELASLHFALAQYDEAEREYRRVVMAIDLHLGPDDAAMISGLTNLGSLLNTVGKYDEAEPILLRAIELSEQLYNDDSVVYEGGVISIAPKVNLSTLYVATDRIDEAEPILVDALELATRLLGPNNYQTLTITNNLAAVYYELGRTTQAELLFRRAHELSEDLLGASHPSTISSLTNLANTLSDAERYEEAQIAFEQGFEAQLQTLGASHPDTITTLFNMAVMRANAAGELVSPIPNRALEVSQEALHSYADRFEQTSINQAQLDNPTSASYLARLNLSIAAQLIHAGDIQREDRSHIAPAFSLAQAFMFSSAADALRASTAALTVNDPELRQLVDRSNSAQAELEAAERLLSTLLSEQANNLDAAAIAAAEARVREAAQVLGQANDALANADLDLANLAVTRAASVEAVQNVLAPDEALILYAQVLNFDAMMVFVVTPDTVLGQGLEITPESLSQQVEFVRAGLLLDTGNNYQLSTSDLENQPFDIAAAKNLHDDIFGPIRQQLEGVRRVLVVADGPLQTLPLHVLVSELPSDGQSGFEQYRAARWLADDFAFSRLPAVSSLIALRRAETPAAKGQRQLIGFGDPVLAGYRAVADTGPVSDEMFFQFANGAGAVSVDSLPALPQTRALLEEVQAILALSDEDIFLGPEAVEETLRALNSERILADYRSVAFATHALINDEIDGLDEPAIVLSPSDSDDGLLRASEVVGLRLDADLVILAACNTAAADGSPGAEALSGLAKAFFYSGARSLLVSNWPAEASATAELIPDLVVGIEENGLTRAQSLQRAMLRLRDDHPFDFYAHPALWAPFMLVADG